MLNYSFQTGEEFALEFMQERATSRPQLLPKNSNANQIQNSPAMSSMAQRRSKSSIPTLQMDNITQSKDIERKTLGLGFSRLEKGASSSIQGSSKRSTPSGLSYNFTPQNVIKFLCSFGGKFLPRPSDGKIRYVGGETYILQLHKNITWKEIVQKTMGLYNRAHTVKYQLPGENIHVLILVSCDEDVHHMIEECDVLRGGEEKPRLFLFSSEDEDDYSSMHFGTGSGDTDSEMRFVSALNGVYSARFKDPMSLKGVASGSMGDLDQLIFDIDGDSTNAASQSSGHDFAMPIKKVSFMETYSSGMNIPTKGISNKMMTINQEYKGRYDEGDDEFIHNSNNFGGKNAGIIRMASSVPSEFRCKNISRPVETLKEFSPLDGGIGLNVGTKGTLKFDNKLFSPKLTRQVSGLKYTQPTKVLSPGSSNKANSRDDPYFGFVGISYLGNYSKYEDDVNSLHNPNISDESLPRSSRPDDAIEIPKILLDEGNLVYSEKMLKNDDKSIETDRDEHIGLVQDTEMNIIKSFSKPRKFGSQEDVERPKVNILRQHTIERSDPDNSIKSRELNAIVWHDDMGISFSNSNSLVRKLTKEEFPLEKFKNNSENKKAELDLVSGSTEERRKGSFEMSLVQQAYNTPTNTHSNSNRSEGGSLQIGHLSQEDRDSVKLPLFEHEEFEPEDDHEASLPKVDLLGRDFDLSNLQIICNEDLEDLRELGSGAFGTVYHGKWRGTDVAIKRIKNSCFTYKSSQPDKLVQEFWREAGILSKLHHPNVLAFYGVVKDGPGGSLATVTEFMVSGSLKRVLLRRDRYLDQRKRIMLAMDTSIGMEYLHDKGVVHFDLKCDNLLVNLKDPSRPICKVADFGLSKMKETTMVSGGMRGTLPWMAPEQLSMSSNKVSEKIDVYSFGIVMWEILTGDEPYDGMHYGQVIGGILNNTLRPPIPNSCDTDWRNLMQRCWAANPNERPSFTEIASRLRVMLDACQTKGSN